MSVLGKQSDAMRYLQIFGHFQNVTLCASSVTGQIAFIYISLKFKKDSCFVDLPQH